MRKFSRGRYGNDLNSYVSPHIIKFNSIDDGSSNDINMFHNKFLEAQKMIRGVTL